LQNNAAILTEKLSHQDRGTKMDAMRFTSGCLKEAVPEKELFYHVSANVSSTDSYIVRLLLDYGQSWQFRVEVGSRSGSGQRRLAQ